MQEVIVFIITGVALAYLGYRFLGKNKSKNCDKCEHS